MLNRCIYPQFLILKFQKIFFLHLKIVFEKLISLKSKFNANEIEPKLHRL
jgi:hypothetical protein